MWHSAFLFQLSYCKQVSFCSLYKCRLFCIFVALLTFLFKMSPKYSAKVLPSVPGHRKSETCLMKKPHVFDKIHLEMSDARHAAGHTFNSNGSTINSKQNVFTQEHHKARLYTNQLWQRLTVTNPVVPLRAMVQYLLLQCSQQLDKTWLPWITRWTVNIWATEKSNKIFQHYTFWAKNTIFLRSIFSEI